MFREMRRKRQVLPLTVCKEILDHNTSGVLSLTGDDGYPYGVPVSYVYDRKNALYFHSAVTGHKIDAIRNDPRASFCVIDKDEVYPAEFTTYFRSVILFGRVMIIESEEEKLGCLKLLGKHYAPDVPDSALDMEISKGFRHCLMLRFNIEHISGKEAIELVCGKNQ